MRAVFGMMNPEKETLQTPCHQHVCQGFARVAEFCPCLATSLFKRFCLFIGSPFEDCLKWLSCSVIRVQGLGGPVGTES